MAVSQAGTNFMMHNLCHDMTESLGLACFPACMHVIHACFGDACLDACSASMPLHTHATAFFLCPFFSLVTGPAKTTFY
jgi:hypothetical protein